MDAPSSGGRDSRFSMGYNMSLLSGETAPEIYTSSVHSRPSTSITSGLSRSSLSLSSGCSAGLQRGIKRTSSDVCFDPDVSSGRSGMSSMTGDCGSEIVDDHGFSSAPQKGSPPSNGKKTKGRVKIKMEYIDNKLRRYTTFSKRKTGIMKKAYELSTLTGTQVMLLVASETGHVYTFATRKLQPMITSEAGKALIQTCLNSPDPCPSGGTGDQRMSATGFEETELSYNIGDEEQKEELSEGPASGGESSSCGSPEPPGMSHQGMGRDSPPPAVPAAHQNTRIPSTSLDEAVEHAPASPDVWACDLDDQELAEACAMVEEDVWACDLDDNELTEVCAAAELMATPIVEAAVPPQHPGAGPGFPVMYPQAGTGVVYASPAPGMPNGGVIFSLGGDAGGRGGQFIIPLPLGGLPPAPPTQAAAADLSKHKK